MGIRVQTRKQRLLQAGFLAQEAQTLSKVPAYVPYIKGLTTRRVQTIIGYRMQGLNDPQIQNAIKDSYRQRGWVKHNGKLDVWAMVRAYEDDYKDRNPEYRSPSQKRRKSTTEDFETKYQNTIAKRMRMGYT